MEAGLLSMRASLEGEEVFAKVPLRGMVGVRVIRRYICREQ
jgi:hypothetical protein